MISRTADRFYRILISLQLAVVLLTAFTLSLIVATSLESAYDTPTAQYFVYRAYWFQVLLLGLGVNILAVALSRLPWKRHHLPFLAAHAGILLLLVGAWVTQRWGVDGMLRVEEGETGATVEIDEPQILMQHAADQGKTRIISFPWRPPGVAVPPFEIGHGIRMDRYISRADPIFSFESNSSERAAPALKLKFTTKRSMGGMPAMAASQEIWLWAGSPEWQVNEIGPARVFFGKAPAGPGPWIAIEPRREGGITFEALSMRQEKSRGTLSASSLAKGAVLDPGWKAIQIEVLEFLPRGIPHTEFVQAKIQHGTKAPPSAIRIGTADESIWLGLGDRVTLKDAIVAYFPRRVVLPFGIGLERFMLERYPGSMQAASFSSRVSVEDGKERQPARVISMNEPLEWKGFTFYQSSYEEGFPRPTVSVFSVNQDPGRWLKYLGSLLLVLGIIWFYFNRMRQRRKA